ncbi:hypothetical protein PPYR_12530 [Photinus pyralis]|uniref:UPAR/Ly6 domain-containing protein n=1 Tax=Photinus pyralis TaxID=7054 RepID=A0A1Y1NA88_PHOPY|nr:hypothetical protein PPYR_12530 [Photinus pyralis]
MVSLRFHLILLFVVLFAVWQIVDSLQCYKCESECAGKNETTNCTEDQTLCMVIKNDSGAIQKQSCAKNDECGNTTGCTTCDKDLCNFSPSFGPSLYIIGIATMLVVSMFTN